MVAEVTEELKHKMEVQEEHIVEVLVPMRNWCDSPSYGGKHYHMVNSSLVSIVPHGHVSSRVSLHRVLTILFSPLVFHLILVEAHWNMDSCSKTR